MRFCLELELKKNEFVVDYRKVIISFIKNAITNCHGGVYYDRFYKDTVSKDYTFGIVFQDPVFQKDKIELLGGNKIKLLFSAENRQKTGFILFTAFINQKNKRFPLPNGNSMILKSVADRRQAEISSTKVVFKTSSGSGICVREHKRETNKDVFYTVNDDKFIEQLLFVLRLQALKSGFNQIQAENIKIKPIQLKKVVVKNYNIYVDVSVGMFEMEADSRLLQYFYEAGCGSKHSSGFGMLDLVTQDLQQEL